MKDQYHEILQQIKAPEPDKNLAHIIIDESLNKKQKHIKNSAAFNNFFKLGFAFLLTLVIVLPFILTKNQPLDDIARSTESMSDYYIYELPTEDELDEAEFKYYSDFS